MTESNEKLKRDRFVFEKAPDGATTDERIAVALEFIAKHIGELSRSADHLNTQMDSLISAAEM